MKWHVYLLLICLLTACATPTASMPTSTLVPPTRTYTPLPTYTLTPSPTLTPTFTPTVIGGSEPIIAFVAKDLQGNINLYIDGVFTKQPKTVTKILLPEKEAFIQLKWSPDGKKLVFTNRDENQETWMFVYDVIGNTFQKIYKVSMGRYVQEYKWSPDSTAITFETVNATCCTPGWAYSQINLKDGTVERVQGNSFWINNVTRVNSETVCYISTESLLHMQSIGYHNICYFPTLNMYGGLKYGKEAIDYDLLSEGGEIQKTLYRFPAGFTTNGEINLLPSPDKSKVLLFGEPNGGIPFAFLISMVDTSVETADPEAMFYEEPIFQLTPPPHSLFRRYVYGWSPDSKNYIEGRFYVDGFNRVNYTAQGEFVVVNSDFGEVTSKYDFPTDINPMLGFDAGFDLVWPAQP